MKSIMQAALAFGVLTWSAGALAQISPEFRNDKIILLEGTPGDGGYWNTTSKVFKDEAGNPYRRPVPQFRQRIRTRMMERRVLEEYAEFLSPLRLPRPLRLLASDCDGKALGDSPHYNPAMQAIDMCYSFSFDAEAKFKNLIRNRRDDKWWTPGSLEQLMAGLYVGVLLHETGHAAFDLMEVPVLGREEDAADQIATFVALQFGKENARTIIKGFSNFWGYLAFVSKADPGPVLGPDDPNYRDCSKDSFCSYADEHGTASQRYYNVLCMALNDQHRDSFSDILEARLLPEGRLQRCNKEYKQVQLAFRKTLLPFIDPAQAEKVMKRTWFTAKESQE